MTSAAALDQARDAERTRWNAWGRATVTGLLSFVGGIVAVTLAFGDVRRDAAESIAKGIDHETRIRVLESTASELKALKDQMTEVRADVKVLLQRTAPK